MELSSAARVKRGVPPASGSIPDALVFLQAGGSVEGNIGVSLRGRWDNTRREIVRLGSRDLDQHQIATGDWPVDIYHTIDVRRLTRQTSNSGLGLGGVLVHQGPHLPAYQ